MVGEIVTRFIESCSSRGVRLAVTSEDMQPTSFICLTVAPGTVPMIPLPLLLAAGVRVGIGNDGVRDLWSPYGNGDLLERLMVVANRCGYSREDELDTAVEAATYGGARVLGVENYGLAPGCRADFVVVEGETSGDALVRHAPRILVVKGGNVVHAKETLNES